MTNRSIHYEAAFEDYLRSRNWPYVAVDEARRAAMLSGLSIKCFDFIVYSQSGPNLLVDVKGRRFPDTSVRGRRRGPRSWENWVTRDDVTGLGEWERIFGPRFGGVFVFAYDLQGPPHAAPFSDVHLYGRRRYAFVAMSRAAYVLAAKPRSEKWRTLSIPAETFRQQVRDLAEFL